MRKISHFMYCIVGLFAISCSSSDDDMQVDNPQNPNNPDPPTAQVDRLNLTSEVMNTDGFNKDLTNTYLWYAQLSGKIVVASNHNTNTPQFMVTYDLSNGSFRDEVTHQEISASGYMSKLVTSGTDLFYISNSAFKYNLITRNWTEFYYPQNAYENNGEAGVVSYQNKIYFLGGRVATTKFKAYSIANNTWEMLPDYNYATTSSMMVGLGDKIYALGGESSKRRFSYYTTQSGWQSLSNLDFDVNTSYSQHRIATHHNRYILVLNGDRLKVYDTVDNLWKQEDLTLSGTNNGDLNIFSDNNFLYTVGRNNNKISIIKYTLHED